MYMCIIDIYLHGINLFISDYDTSEEMLLCSNKKPFPSAHRCLYDVDEHGLLKTCRDGTHLDNCGKYRTLI